MTGFFHWPSPETDHPVALAIKPFPLEAQVIQVRPPSVPTSGWNGEEHKSVMSCYSRVLFQDRHGTGLEVLDDPERDDCIKRLVSKRKSANITDDERELWMPRSAPRRTRPGRPAAGGPLAATG